MTKIDFTELQWTYQPSDLFEAPIHHHGDRFQLTVDDGLVTARLDDAEYPVPPETEEPVAAYVKNLLALRALQTHRDYTLGGPTVHAHEGESVHVAVRVPTARAVVIAGPVDFIHRDANGNVIRDSKAERIAIHSAQLESVTQKMAESAELRSLVDRYLRATKDPANELVYLYEVREGIAEFFGGESQARSALGISKATWTLVGRLSNHEPLKQGRHRGRHLAGLRPATQAELEEARTAVRSWILAFADCL